MTRETELRALAEKATPGPWSTPGPDSPGQWMVYDYQWCIATATVYTHNEPLSNRAGATGPGYIDADNNAAYIAAVDPQTVLALLDVAEAAAAQPTYNKKALRAALDRLDR